MRILARELWAAARLDAADVIRSRWALFAGFVYALLAAAFIMVGLRESTVMGFSGMGRVLLSLVHALSILLPLLALAATGQVINKARDDGTLELLFSHPVRRGAYFVATSLTRYLFLTVPLFVVLILMAVLGRVLLHQAIHWPFVAQTMAVSAALIAAFVGIGLAVSTFVRNQARAVISVLVVWVTFAALLDFALIAVMLRSRLAPQLVFLLAALNPIQSARMALLAGATSELSVLGPVGFYLSHRLGPGPLYMLGIAWPTVLGLATWATAFASFRRTDIV